MNKVRHIDLFSGIGGFALAAQMVWGAAHQPVLFCDNDAYCQAVLREHWPDVPIYNDILDLTAKRHWQGTTCSATSIVIVGSENSDAHEQQIDLLAGGFPCQPFSLAGHRRGVEDDRYLWPQMHRVIREFSPRWVIAENVRGLLSQERGVVFEQVCSDLERLSYDVQAFVVPACAVGAPHRRDRVWIIAHAKHSGQHGTKTEQALLKEATVVRPGRTNLANLRDQIAYGQSLKTTGERTGLVLQPAFVEWMMGYPEGWTELPDSKPSEMRSSLKSRSR